MELSSLIDLIHHEVEKNIKEEIIGLEREEIANKLSIATLKYADLLPFRKTDYIFDPVKFSSLDGKTGPYILYTIVRIKSLLRKNDETDYSLININNNEVRDLLIKLLAVDNVLKKSKEEATLNYISDYIYEILSLYNTFYNNNNILNEKDLDIKKTYLALSKLTYTVAHSLLDILAINEVDRM
jgi:arginyl-tRNA synthetase